MINQFRNYLGVGLINFGVCIATMRILSYFDVHYLTYTAIAYGLAICCSFFLNLKFTFTDSSFSHQRMFRFFLVSLVNLGLVELIEYHMISGFKVRELYAVIAGMTWYTATGFIVNKFYVYADYTIKSFKLTKTAWKP